MTVQSLCSYVLASRLQHLLLICCPFKEEYAFIDTNYDDYLRLWSVKDIYEAYCTLFFKRTFLVKDRSYKNMTVQLINLHVLNLKCPTYSL